VAEVTLNGVLYSFDVEGTGDPPFLFIHGLACDRQSWTPQVQALSESHRCVAVDLRGRGDTTPIPPFDTSQAAEDVAALIRQLGLPPVIVVGHSLGGLVALLLNHRHGDLVRGVVLCDAALTGAANGSFKGLRNRIREEGRDSLVPLVESFFVDSTSDEVRTYVRDVMLGCPPDVAAGMLDNDEVFQTEMATLLKAADAKPFMALWPSRPIGNPDKLREMLVFLRQEPVADSGHFLQLEHPAVTTALLRAFLDDVERDPRVNQPV
jgi:pimeloyl-ACP methyl ester carboxylesterase